MTDLITTQGADLAVPLGKAQTYAEQATAENTRRAYSADWRHFVAWCDTRAAQSLPADVATVAAYLADCAEQYKLATVERRLTSISKAHQLASVPNPTKTEQIHLVIKDIRRALGHAQRQAAPAVTEIIKAMVEQLGQEPHTSRDRALLLLGFAGAFRRSELVALNVEDLQFSSAGVAVTVRRSKTDQEGQGITKDIPLGLNAATCPVRALRAWIEAAELVSGPIFRPVDRHGNISTDRLTGHAVARIVKRAAGAAGLDASAFSGHSLRAGLATAAAAAGASDRSIQKQTGHKSRAMLDRYIRAGQLFKDNAAGVVGL